MYLYEVDPHYYQWEGGVRAGYAILNQQGQELWRVWSEGQAEQTIASGVSQPEWLVDTTEEVSFRSD